MKSFIKKTFLIAVVFYSAKVEAQNITGSSLNSQNYILKFTNSSSTAPTAGASQIFDNGTFVGIGGTTQIGGENLLVQKSWNGGTFERIYNNATGTAASAGYIVTTNGSGISIAAYNTSFTSSGIYGAGTGVLNSSGPNGMNIGTTVSSPLTFWTNNMQKMTLTSGGNFGIGTTAPVTALHVNGDFTFGSMQLIISRWRFITQNWIDGGKMFLQPDQQNGSGNVDQTQGMTIDPILGFCDFGNQMETTNISVGNINSNNTAFNNGTSYIGFNAQRNMSNGNWASNGAASANGGGIIWGNTIGSLLFSPQLEVSGGNTYSDVAVLNRKTMEIRWDYTDGIGQVVIGTKTLTTGTNTNFRLQCGW